DTCRLLREPSRAFLERYACRPLSLSVRPSDSAINTLVRYACIDALIATTLNYRLNGIFESETQFVSDDLLTSKDNGHLENFLAVGKSFIVLGDMFYDTDFAEKVLAWLCRLKQRTATRILIGDPNRHPLGDEQLNRYETNVMKKQLRCYSLPDFVMREHYGFSAVNVIELQFIRAQTSDR
ncbi:unnamed protein product, partial [Cylicostephanus goldi]